MKTTANQTKIKVTLVIAMTFLALTPLWSSPMLKKVYHSMYKVEFGPKYVELAGKSN